MRLVEARRAVAEAAREVHAAGLVQGTAGNVSLRDEESGLVAITPSALACDSLEAEDVALVDVEANLIEGRYAPSSETPMHTEVYRKMPWVRGVVHTHSIYATTFACLGRPIEPAHYLIAMVGGRIPVAPYATFGTREIGQNAVDSFGDSLAVLLAQHGVLAIGHSLEEAVNVASATEFVAEVYYKALLLDQPALIPPDELVHLKGRFARYVVQAGPSAEAGT